MIKEIIWDWNGTLLNDAQYSVNQINKLLDKYDLSNITLDKYRKIFTFPIIQYYKNLGFDFEKYSFAEVGKEFIDLYNRDIDLCNLHDKAHETMFSLKQAGIKQVVISAREKNDLAKDLEKYGVLPFIDTFYGIENIYGEGKAGLFEKYLQDNTTPRNEILLIGDTSHDCEIAKKFSLKFAFFTGGHQDFSHLSSCEVYFVINNLEEIDPRNSIIWQ